MYGRRFFACTGDTFNCCSTESPSRGDSLSVSSFESQSYTTAEHSKYLYFERPLIELHCRYRLPFCPLHTCLRLQGPLERSGNGRTHDPPPGSTEPVDKTSSQATQLMPPLPKAQSPQTPVIRTTELAIVYNSNVFYR